VADHLRIFFSQSTVYCSNISNKCDSSNQQLKQYTILLTTDAFCFVIIFLLYTNNYISTAKVSIHFHGINYLLIFPLNFFGVFFVFAYTLHGFITFKTYIFWYFGTIVCIIFSTYYHILGLKRKNIHNLYNNHAQ